MNVNMTKEFSSTLLEMQRGRNLLITGHAGTGKSTLLCTFINDYSNGRNCLIIAPTEDAASKNRHRRMCSTCENWRISGICVVLVTFSQQTKNRGTEPEAPPLIFRRTHDNKRGRGLPLFRVSASETRLCP